MSDRRLLRAERSKLGIVDLSTILRKEGAWDMLSYEKRKELYDMLPANKPGEAPHDPDVNPLKTSLRSYIEEELRVFQDDLKFGKEGRKWREEAMMAGVERKEGKYDEWKESEREKEFGGVQRAGSVGTENAKDGGGESEA
ncbi:hypothetical protein LTR17_025196 [Elasticomyces elasticus]|nr:hypothetical protein LTR17_025196 [Elasticomyces elasticus]